MKLYKVTFDHGVTTHNIFMRARSHEEAEKESLLLTKLTYDDIKEIEVTPMEVNQ